MKASFSSPSLRSECLVPLTNAHILPWPLVSKLSKPNSNNGFGYMPGLSILSLSLTLLEFVTFNYAAQGTPSPSPHVDYSLGRWLLVFSSLSLMPFSSLCIRTWNSFPENLFARLMISIFWNLNLLLYLSPPWITWKELITLKSRWYATLLRWPYNHKKFLAFLLPFLLFLLFLLPPSFSQLNHRNLQNFLDGIFQLQHSNHPPTQSPSSYASFPNPPGFQNVLGSQGEVVTTRGFLISALN